LDRITWPYLKQNSLPVPRKSERNQGGEKTERGRKSGAEKDKTSQKGGAQPKENEKRRPRKAQNRQTKMMVVLGKGSLPERKGARTLYISVRKMLTVKTVAKFRGHIST